MFFLYMATTHCRTRPWLRSCNNTRHTQPFYSSLDFVQDNPGELVPEGTFRHLLDFLVQNKDNRQTHQQSGWTATYPDYWCPIFAFPITFYDGGPSWHNPPNLSWLGTGTKYAGLHTRWHGLHTRWLGSRNNTNQNKSTDYISLCCTRLGWIPPKRINFGLEWIGYLQVGCS